MFVFRKNYAFDWPVKVPEGITPAFEFTAKFKSLPTSDFNAIIQKDPLNSDRNTFLEIFIGWNDGDLVDESQQPLTPTPETIAQLADQAFFCRAVVTAYLAAQRGELHAKN